MATKAVTNTRPAVLGRKPGAIVLAPGVVIEAGETKVVDTKHLRSPSVDVWKRAGWLAVK